VWQNVVPHGHGEAWHWEITAGALAPRSLATATAWPRLNANRASLDQANPCQEGQRRAS
jgi:hypothetical protein